MSARWFVLQKRTPWTHKELDLVLHGVSGPVLQAGDAERFHQALGFQSPAPFSRVSKQGLCFTAIEEDGGSKRLVELELACEADGVAPPDPVYILLRQS